MLFEETNNLFLAVSFPFHVVFLGSILPSQTNISNPPVFGGRARSVAMYPFQYPMHVSVITAETVDIAKKLSMGAVNIKLLNGHYSDVAEQVCQRLQFIIERPRFRKIFSRSGGQVKKSQD